MLGGGPILGPQRVHLNDELRVLRPEASDTTTPN